MLAKLRHSLLIILSATALLSGCSTKIKDIEIVSASLDSITPKGLKSAEATFSVSIKNPAMEFTLSEISGVLYHEGQEIVQYSAEDITVNGQTTAVYPLTVTATLVSDMSVLKILSIAKNYKNENFTTDISAKASLRSGVGKTLNFKDIPISELMQ